LQNNEAFVEDATRATTVPVTDLMATFAVLFGSLANSKRVRVRRVRARRVL